MVIKVELLFSSHFYEKSSNEWCPCFTVHSFIIFYRCAVQELKVLQPFRNLLHLFPHFSVTQLISLFLLLFFFLLIRTLVCFCICVLYALSFYNTLNKPCPTLLLECAYFYEHIHFLHRSASPAQITIPATFNHFNRRYFEHLAFHWLWFSFFCGCCLSGEECGTVESFCSVTGCQRFSFTVTVGRSEEGLALCHFSGRACFMDMWVGVSVAD